MKIKLKPLIRYASPHTITGRTGVLLEIEYGIKYLCLPITPASRKSMIEAIVEKLEEFEQAQCVSSTPKQLAAKYALDALIEMSKGQGP